MAWASAKDDVGLKRDLDSARADIAAAEAGLEPLGNPFDGGGRWRPQQLMKAIELPVGLRMMRQALNVPNRKYAQIDLERVRQIAWTAITEHPCAIFCWHIGPSHCYVRRARQNSSISSSVRPLVSGTRK